MEANDPGRRQHAPCRLRAAAVASRQDMRSVARRCRTLRLRLVVVDAHDMTTRELVIHVRQQKDVFFDLMRETVSI